jgi:amino acid adenylation domain-containing protein
LWEWVVQAVDSHAHLVAIESEDVAVTYEELAQRAAAIATLLPDTAPGTRVGLLASKTPVAYLSYLAILRAGGVPVPLGLQWPPARVAAIAELAALEVTLAEPGTDAHADALRERGVRVIEPTERDVARETRVPARPAALDDVAYILFTSGSTGVPKGVPIRHRNVSPLVELTSRRFELAPGARVAQTYDLTFDPSIFSVFATLACGATIVLPGRRDWLDPVAFVRTREITHWTSVPSMISLARRLRLLEPCTMSGLRHSLFCGEPLTLEQADAWHRAAPESALCNAYGPTETTVFTADYLLPSERDEWPRTVNGTVPIGEAYPHMEAAVVDEEGAPSTTGELVVRGAQRFDGYLEPSENANRFVAFDGARATPLGVAESYTADAWYRTGDAVTCGDHGLVHLGRLDNQVKVRGYRVELEAVLRRWPGVVDAVVVPVPGELDDIDLCAVYTGDRAPREALVEFMRERVPPYMLPRRLEHLEELPLTVSGKIDRRRIAAELEQPRRPRSRPHFAPNRR